MLIVCILVLLLSFYLLHFFSEHYFIPALDGISKKLKLSSDIAGSTLMAAGSSAPELAVVLIAVFRPGGHNAIGVGTIVGSALFNLFVIVGAAMLVKNKDKLLWQPLIRDLLFYALSVILLVWFFADGSLTAWEAGIFVASYAVYIAALYYWKKLFPYKDIEQYEKEETGMEEHGALKGWLNRFIPDIKNVYTAFFVSIVAISLLSWALVESAVNISEILGIPEVIIALTVLAVGTSVPDLVSSVIVAKQGRPGMAINNAIGSNIFDILIGLGLPFLLMLLFTTGQITVGIQDLDVAFWLLLGSIFILIITLILSRWYAKRSVGYMMIILYLFYLSYEVACSLGYCITT